MDVPFNISITMQTLLFSGEYKMRRNSHTLELDLELDLARTVQLFNYLAKFNSPSLE